MESSNAYIYSQLLQMVIVTAVMIWLVIMCARRKSEGKDLTKASNIVSMPEVRKFKLDLSGKQQEEVDVDLDMQFDDVGIGNEVPITTNASPQLVSNNVLQVIVKKTKGKSERCKKDDKEESTQSSLERQRMSRKNVHSQSGSRIMKDLQEKQWEEPIGGIENIDSSARKGHDKARTDPTQTEATKQFEI